MITRKKTLQIKVGTVKIGGSAPISVQSMTKTDTRDVKATLAQIRKLEKAGCEIVRIAVPDQQAVNSLGYILSYTGVPIIADVHFHYRLALKAIDAGIQGLRINPGNIGSKKNIAAIVNKARQRDIPIRVGINAGSLEKDILKKYGRPTPEALVESALKNIRLLETLHFQKIKVSLKSHDIRTTVDAYRMLSKKCRYPLHIGITEAGTVFSGTVKSSVGLGILLEQGIGDTIRVSLTGDPVEEVRVAYEILKGLGLRRKGPEIISCPTCGRCQINVADMARKIEKRLALIASPVTVAVMGCEVNGPGEAREADIGIAATKRAGVIFKKGEIVKKCRKDELLRLFFKEIEKMEKGNE